MTELDMRMPVVLSHGIPDSTTPGWVGLLAMDVTQTSKPIYKCTAADNQKKVYAWKPIESGGGGSGGGGDYILTDADKAEIAIAVSEIIEIPAKTSDLQNDSGFITKAVTDLANYYAKSQTYNRDEINERISAIPKFAISVVSALPTSGISTTTIYLVKSGSGADLYTEYIYTGGAWEILGSQRVDLTGYATEAWVNAKIADFLTADKLTAAMVTGALGFTPAKATDVPAVDSTLKVSGAAADAKAVGDKVNQLSTEITDLETEVNGKQPKGNYALSSELAAETTAREQAVASLNARLGQQTVLIAEGETQEEAESWLETDADKTKVYLMPDDTFWQYKKTTEITEGGVAYTNLLPKATDTDGVTIYGGDYNGDGVNDGYKTETRLSGSSGNTGASAAPMCVSGFIPAQNGDVIRIKNAYAVSGSTAYVISYNAAKARINNQVISQASDLTWSDTTSWATVDKTDGNLLTFTLSSDNFGADIEYIRFNADMTSGNTIITVNQEIKEGGGTTTTIVEKWVTTGHGLIATNYDAIIAELSSIVTAHTEEIKALKEGADAGTALTDSEKLTLIRNWDKPVFERLTPFLLDTDLTITNYPQSYADAQDPDGALRRQNVQAVYDEYNALCTAHPDFVRDITDKEHGLEGATETTFGGICSDGIQYVRVYEFCEREGRHSNTTNADYWSETKPTIVIVSGIHWEYNGVYSMLNALKIITENPEFRDMRRNCRFIVIPMSNPYCFTTYNNSGGGHYNANGVEIHNNFAVDFNNTIDSTHGTAPFSEIETRYIDNAMRKYADTGVCLLTCHSNASKGSNFIWGSVATKYMCNVSLRLVDLMSYAWDTKYDNYRTAIDTQKSTGSNPQEDGDYRCGFASLSTSTGTETKQALWYGMQGINVEVYEKFYLFDPDGTDVSLAVSRGAEVYANLLRLLAVTYDHNDRDKYAPNPPYKLES